MSVRERYERYLRAKELEREDRRERLRIWAGLADFGGVVLAIVVILALLALLLSLLSWLRQDIASTFAIFLNRF